MSARQRWNSSGGLLRKFIIIKDIRLSGLCSGLYVFDPFLVLSGNLVLCDIWHLARTFAVGPIGDGLCTQPTWQTSILQIKFLCPLFLQDIHMYRNQTGARASLVHMDHDPSVLKPDY
jgi:hypothetical protein